MKLWEEYENIMLRWKLGKDDPKACEEAVRDGIELLSVNLDETLHFLKNCHSWDFAWMKELIPGIARRTRSQDIIDGLYSAAERFPEISRGENIIPVIDRALELVTLMNTPEEHLYTVQTMKGRESILIAMLTPCIRRPVYDAFCPGKYRMFKAEECWYEKRQTLFPGYIFIRTAEPVQLFHNLKKVPGWSNLLHDGEYSFYRLNDEEEAFIDEISLLRDCSLGISRIEFVDMETLLEERKTSSDYFLYRSADRQSCGIHVVDGPLKKWTDHIVRFQLHRRYAEVKLRVLGEAILHMAIELPGDRMPSLATQKVV